MWSRAALRLLPLLACTAALLSCGSGGPESCQALEKCCAALEAPQSASCRDGLDQALASGASEADLDAACAGSLRAYSAAGSCEAPDAPAGGLQLDVLSAAFLPRSSFELERAKLLVVISLRNGSGGAPAFLSPTFFTVGTEGGVGVAAQLTSELPQSCAPDLALLADGEVQCLLVFAVPSGLLPVSLSYTNPDGRLASAVIPKCSTAVSDEGLCPEGEVCSAGMCATPCSREAPTGACTFAEDRCIRGSCTSPCSREAPTGACAFAEDRCIRGSCTSPCGAGSPDGFCEVGTCVDGVCDQACLDIADVAPVCSLCFEESGCKQAAVACGDECFACLWQQTPSERCMCQAERCGDCLGWAAECLRRVCPEC